MSTDPRHSFLHAATPKFWLILNALSALLYFFAIAFFFERGNMILFYLLLAGEVFHVWQVLTFLHTIWKTDYQPKKDARYRPAVDVFITAVSEPVEIVAETIRAAQAMRYPDFQIYLLNDGYGAKKNTWQEMAKMAKDLGVKCFTRRKNSGFKAGNINNALKHTSGDLVVIFDADHVPHEDFLEKTVPYFSDNRVGFVQAPQFYRNQNLNFVTTGAWEQQALFFGPICKGRNRFGSVTMCGTNMVIRRKALKQVGGICEENIAEDFITGLFIHEKGWRSVYVPEVLAEGLAPEDFLTYSKQQFRWARGSMDLIFRYNPLFRRSRATWQQKLEYLSSVSFFLSGAVVLMNALIPLVFFFTGLTPFNISTMAIALVFIPYISLTIYVLAKSSNFSFTFRSLAFAMAGFDIHLKSLIVSALGLKSAFVVSSKKQVTGNFINLVTPHLAYAAAVIMGIGIAFAREGLSPSLVTNIAWATINLSIFGQFIIAALPQKEGLRLPKAEALLAPRIAVPALKTE